MKEHNEQFEANVSRLVKSCREGQVPPEAFTRELVERGLGELKKQKGRSWPRRLATAAALLVAAAGVFSLMLPEVRKAKQPTGAMSEPTKLLSDNGVAPTDGLIMPAEIPAERQVAVNIMPPPPPPSLQPSATPPARLRSVAQPMVRPEAAVKVSVSSEPLRYDIVVKEGGVYSDSSVSSNPPMAHGGTTPPNNAAYDAMFFKNYGVNPFVDTEDDRLSTFAIDADTGSYTLCRQYLQDGHLPPAEAVRVEEFVNYFDYDYPAPEEETFAVYTEAMAWRFGQGRRNSHLLRIGIKGMEVAEENHKPAVLTFVIDVSGSMNRENRLGLVKQSLEMLVERLRPEDRIGIAVYGSSGRAILRHVGLENKEMILSAIRCLGAEGSTNAEEGIRIGYEMADEAFKPGYINRVILCSDGVANVGRTGPDQILGVIQAKADKGITLSALGFGMGNYNDVLMEQLGDKGNGYYAYIDTIDEARRLFGGNLAGALQVIARDVKIQVEFEPRAVQSWRLIGYENRDVADRDFRNDAVDGGEIGAGHAVTALYELKLRPEARGTAATVRIRYKDPDTFEATEISEAFDTRRIERGFASVSRSFGLACVAGEFAEILRESYWAKEASLKDTLIRAQKLSAEYPADSQVIELVDLIARANRLRAEKGEPSPAEGPAVPLEE